MNLVVLTLALLASSSTSREQRIQQLVTEIVNKGGMLEFNEQQERLSDPRRRLAPGAPPLLSFRYLQGADRGRFGNLDLMLDDAGH